MYHCHIMEHEDNGMMGQFLVVEEPGQLTDLTRVHDTTSMPWGLADSARDQRVQ